MATTLVTFTTLATTGPQAGHAVTYRRPMRRSDLANLTRKDLTGCDRAFHVCAKCCTDQQPRPGEGE